MTSHFRGKSVVLSPENIIRLNVDHTKVIEKLVNKEQTYKLFGEIEVERLLTLCYLALGITDDDGKVVGALFLQPYPNISALPTDEWAHWVQTKYSLNDVNSRNTLWVHLIVSDPVYYLLFLKPLLHYLFQARNFLHYAIMVIPPGRHKLDFTCNMGVSVIPEDCRKGQTPYLLLFSRNNFIIQYKIRRAVEEDNDDLVPLIETYSTRFTKMYGEFYIAEILMRGKETGRQVIVAEYQGSAVAVLCLNSDVNYEVLNEDFELVPYNGLKKRHEDDYEDLDSELQASTDKIRRSKTFDDDIVDIIDRKSYVESAKEFGGEEEEEEELTHVSPSESDQFSIIFTSASMFIFQDDEDLLEGQVNDLKTSSSEELLSTYMGIQEKKEQLDNKDEKDIADKREDWVSAYSASRGMLLTAPQFKGEPNAFALEIAASLPNHEYGIIELFDAAFECFPDRDYCVMAVPHTVPVKKLTNYFGRVPPRNTGTFPFELYVMHKNSMLASIDVEAANKSHEKAVNVLLSTITNNKMVQDQFDHYLKILTSPYFAYVAVSEGLVVGLAIVSEETEQDYLIAHYDLSVLNMKIYRTGTQGVLETVILSPIFQRHDKYFLKEIHRLSEFDILYYRHSPYDSSEAYRDRPLSNTIMNLLPIMPLMLPQYDVDYLKEEGFSPSETVSEKQEPFALYVSTMPLCSLNKNIVSTKILVVGCSHTALSFLQSLIFKQSPNYMVTFYNITMLSANGLAHNRVSPRIRDVFVVKKNFWDTRFVDNISIKTYINLLHGKITKIDRKEQYVAVNNNSFIDYDLLFLMSGEQFQRPKPFREKPENVIVLNNALDANQAVFKLKHLYYRYNRANYVIIIYGHFLQAHTAIHGLINYGILGSHLVLVEPFPYSMALEKRQRHNVSIYNDPEIDAVVYDNMRSEGVKIYSSYYFIDWVYDCESNLITKVRFESKHKMLEFECMALFFFNEKEINPRIYRIINNAGLVYDGRLVIDANCRTNDPNIYGAGTLTKYSRKYYAPNMLHKFFNRLEIGKRLGLQIRDMLVQQKTHKWDQEAAAGWNLYIERGESLVPRFVDPILRFCRLPGGLYYLSITKPGRRTPLETAVSLESYGQVLITGNCKALDKQGYFQLHLNQFGRVETITCLSKDPIDVFNIHCIWGKHEKLLNNLALRFEMVHITDLYEYFKEPWAYAIYHDKFNCLLDDLNMLMTSSISGDASLINELIARFKESKWKDLSKTATDSLEEIFRGLSYPKIIESKLLNFIKQNLRHLPMYAHPVVVRELLRNFSNSPLFSS